VSSTSSYRLGAKFSLILLAAYCVLIVYLDWQFQLAAWMKYLLLLLNIVTAVCYWIDKRAAERSQWRVQENTLLLLGFAGGWPAAFVCQQWLRHKNRKLSFQLLFWLTVLSNSWLMLWLWQRGWLG